MARASYIYVIVDRAGLPKQAFTVKHELLDFMRVHAASLPGRMVHRLPDGGDGSTLTQDALEYLTENTK